MASNDRRAPARAFRRRWKRLARGRFWSFSDIAACAKACSPQQDIIPHIYTAALFRVRRAGVREHNRLIRGSVELKCVLAVDLQPAGSTTFA